MNGKSRAVLVGANDGNLYVTKFPNGSERPNALLNEIAGHEIYRLVGLPVPVWNYLSISSRLINGNRDCWFSSDDRLATHSCICFGSRFIARPPKRVYEILPGSMFRYVCNREHFWLSWIVDVLSRQCNCRQALFVEDMDSQLRTVFIDHSELFGGHDGSEIPSHTQAQYFDPRIYLSPNAGMKRRLCDRLRSFESDAVWRRLLFLPDEWKTSSAMRAVRDGLNRLSDFELARSICDELIDSFRIPSSGRSAKSPVPEHMTIPVAAFTH